MATPLSYTTPSPISTKESIIHVKSCFASPPSPPASDVSLEFTIAPNSVETTNGASKIAVLPMQSPLLTEEDTSADTISSDDIDNNNTTNNINIDNDNDDTADLAVGGIRFQRSMLPSGNIVSNLTAQGEINQLSSFHNVNSSPEPVPSSPSSHDAICHDTTTNSNSNSIMTHGINPVARTANATLAATLVLAEGNTTLSPLSSALSSSSSSPPSSPSSTMVQSGSSLPSNTGKHHGRSKARRPLSILRKKMALHQKSDTSSTSTYRCHSSVTSNDRIETDDDDQHDDEHDDIESNTTIATDDTRLYAPMEGNIHATTTTSTSTATNHPMQPVKLSLKNWMEMVPSVGKIVKTMGRHIYHGPPQPSWSMSNHITIASLQSMLPKLPSEIAADPVQLNRMRYAWERAAKDDLPGFKPRRRSNKQSELPLHPIHQLSGFGFQPLYPSSSSTPPINTRTASAPTSPQPSRNDRSWIPSLLGRNVNNTPKSPTLTHGPPAYSPAAYAAGGGIHKPGIKVYVSTKSKGHIQIRSSMVPVEYSARATHYVQSLGLTPDEKDVAAAAAYSPTSTLDSSSTSSHHHHHHHHDYHSSDASMIQTLSAEWVTWHPTMDKAKSYSSPSVTAAPTTPEIKVNNVPLSRPATYGYRRSRPHSAYSLEGQPPASPSSIGSSLRGVRPQSCYGYGTIPRIRSPLSGAASVKSASSSPNIPASMLSPHEPKPAVILYLHGGGYFSGSALTHRSMTSRLAQDTGAAVFALNYRLAPEHSFPAALQDALAAYFYLTQTYLTDAIDAAENNGSDAGSISLHHHQLHREDKQGVSPDRVIIAGDSAGGGLAVALLLALRDLRLPSPAGAITLSPWLDQTSSSASATSHSITDFIPNPSVIDEVGNTWWQSTVGHEHFYVRQRSLLTCPYVSPLWAKDLSGLPPILLQVGGAERFKDEVVHFAQQAVSLPNTKAPSSSGNSLRLGRTASIVRLPTTVRLEVYEEMPHVWACFPNMPATRVSQARAAKFIHDCFAGSSQMYPEYLQIAPSGELLQHGHLPLDTIPLTR